MLVVSKNNRMSAIILENKPVVFIGRISFGLYIWHQFLLAYARYFVFLELHFKELFLIFVIAFILSVLTYFFVEQIFRNRNKMSNRAVLTVVAPAIFISLSASGYLYLRHGVIKDIPELEVSKSSIASGNFSAYNESIEVFRDHDFLSDTKIKTLVLGDSYGRDFINILLKSKYSENIELSYGYYNSNYSTERLLKENKGLLKRAEDADIIFLTDNGGYDIIDGSVFDIEKIWYIGVKGFGEHNTGYFYNYRGKDYYGQRARVPKSVIEINTRLKTTWGDHFINILDYIIDENNTVPVFTPRHKFISFDCWHLTRAGAEYLSVFIDRDDDFIFSRMMHRQEK